MVSTPKGRIKLKELVSLEMEKRGDSWKDFVCSASPSSYEKPQDVLEEIVDTNSISSGRSPAFYVWTYNRVYFLVHHDGEDWVASVPRCPDPTEEPEGVGEG